MDEFEKFLENIEINLLNHSFEVDTVADVQPTKRRCRRIILSESENSDDEISRVIADTVKALWINCCNLFLTRSSQRNFRMPLTGAERQKKYIEKLKEQNPEKYEEKRKKHLEKVKQKQKKYQILLIVKKKLEDKNGKR
ncbi:unnamed protein product [Arctia plantaginis]|uniref:Uncharacterized protein n=1 Tax=Arctia plantaginis TaxID=874455 RepID=A0A8S1B453_ARCPL|nr:unnamed protein product [Arctia plantaginis]